MSGPAGARRERTPSLSVPRSTIAPKRRDTDLLTPSDGVLWPDGLLTNPIGRSAARPSRSSAAESSRAPRRRDVLIVRLRACRLDREDRGKEAKDQEHRERDRDSDPSDGEGELARGCVHAGETPTRLFLFRRFGQILMGILSGVGEDCGLVLIEHLFYTGRPLSAASTGANRGADPVRRTPLPLQLLVPRRRVGARRPGRAGGRARA